MAAGHFRAAVIRLPAGPDANPDPVRRDCRLPNPLAARPLPR